MIASLFASSYKLTEQQVWLQCTFWVFIVAVLSFSLGVSFCVLILWFRRMIRERRQWEALTRDSAFEVPIRRKDEL